MDLQDVGMGEKQIESFFEKNTLVAAHTRLSAGSNQDGTVQYIQFLFFVFTFYFIFLIDQ